MNLIKTWLAAGKAFGYKTNLETLAEMNRSTGLSIPNSRMYQWRKGTRKPPAPAINYMLQVSIMYALIQIRPRIKLTNDEVMFLAEMLSIPEGDIEK